MIQAASSSSVTVMPPSPPVVQCLLWQKLKAPAWPMVPTFLPLYVPPCASAQSSITISLCFRAMAMISSMSHTQP